MITQSEAKSSWRTIVGAVKEKFGDITGDDLTKVEGDLDKLISLVQRKSGQSREWVESFVSNAANQAESQFNRVSEVASQYAGQATEAMRENYEYVADSAQRGYQQTMRTVSRRPLESVAIALGAGVLAGLIVGLSMASHRR